MRAITSDPTTHPPSQRHELSTLVQGGTSGFPWGAALGVVILYGVVAAAVSLVVFRTRDIVA
jgi:hypothetical protein